MKRTHTLGFWGPLVLPATCFYLPVSIWLVTVDWGSSRDPSFVACLTLVAHTLIISTAASAIALLAGSVLGIAFEVYAVRGRAVLLPIALLPFFLPTVVITTASQAMFAGGQLGFLARGFPGAISLTAWTVTPLVFWGVSRAVASIPAAERMAMRQGFGVHTVAWTLVARRVYPTALRLGLLSVLLTLPRLEIPEFAGVETIAVRILGAFTALENDAEGWLLVASTLAVLVPVGWFALRPLARLAEAPTTLADAASHERSRWPGLVLWSVVLVQLAPLLVLLRVAFDAPIQAGEFDLMTTTLVSESLRALVVAVLVVLFGFWAAESGAGVRTMVVLAVPMLLPGSLIGLALVESVQRHLPLAVVESTLLLSVAQGTRFAVVGGLFGWLAIRSIPLAERHAAAWVAETPRRYRVLLPRSVPVLSTGVLVVFVLILGEVECAHLLSPAGYLPPVLALYQMLHFRFDEQAAQVALSLVAVCSFVTVGLMRWGRGLR